MPESHIETQSSSWQRRGLVRSSLTSCGKKAKVQQLYYDISYAVYQCHNIPHVFCFKVFPVNSLYIVKPNKGSWSFGSCLTLYNVEKSIPQLLDVSVSPLQSFNMPQPWLLCKLFCPCMQFLHLQPIKQPFLCSLCVTESLVFLDLPSNTMNLEFD